LSRVRFLILIAMFFSFFVVSSDNAISGISPEYKEAAQKRQAEIARQMFCSEKAGKEKVMKRDLASFVVGCMDAIERAEQAIIARPRRRYAWVCAGDGRRSYLSDAGLHRDCRRRHIENIKCDASSPSRSLSRLFRAYEGAALTPEEPVVGLNA